MFVSSKTTVKAVIKTTYERELKDKMKTSKLKDGPILGKFRLRSNTTNVKMNRKSDPGYGEGCANLDMQCHIMCPLFDPSERAQREQQQGHRPLLPAGFQTTRKPEFRRKLRLIEPGCGQ